MHRGRKLQWLHSHSSAILLMHGINNNKSTDLVLSCSQALVCLAVDGKSSRSISELMEETGLPIEEVKRVCASMLFNRHKILVRADDDDYSDKNEKKPGSLDKNDRVKVNMEFICKQPRIRIPLPKLIVKKGADEKQKRVYEETDRERQYSIDATIVRIMKARRVLSHQDLVAQITEQIKLFHPCMAIIKKQIESLIGREFLRRKQIENGSCAYEYIS